MRFVKPLDADLAADLAATHDLVVTIEENAVMGGAGSAVAEVLAERASPTPLLQLGLPDRFIDHGDQAQLLASVGLDGKGVVSAIRARLG
jgi:1-deoxy-D-xylulose-5-phosphate synthase